VTTGEQLPLYVIVATVVILWLALLEQNGWRSISHDDEVTLLHLYRAMQTLQS